MKIIRKSLLFGLETVEGTDPGLVAGDAIKTTGLTVTLYAGNKISLDYDNSGFAASSQINVNPYTQLQFGVMLASSGAAGTAPAWGPVLQCCGFDETINAGVSAAYSGLSASIPSGTGYFLRPEEAGVNDQVYETNGVRGDASITLTAGQFPMVNFQNMMGSYNTPVEATLVTPDFTGWLDPLPLTVDNTPTITVGGYSACLQSLTHNCNNDVVYENIPGCTGCRIRDANWGGTLTVKAPTITDKDFFTYLESHSGVTTFAVQIVHGTTSGAIIQLDYTAMQLFDMQEVDVNGDVGYQFSFVDVGNTMVLTAK